MSAGRRWCSWIFWGEAGTSLAYGWATMGRGALAGVHGPTEYLVQPEHDGEPRWVCASAIDFNPIRKEGAAHVAVPAGPAQTTARAGRGQADR